MWYSKDIFRYMFKAEFVTLVSLKVPSGNDMILLVLTNSTVKIEILL